MTDVDPNGKAYDAGIRDGDVIVELAGKPISNAQQLEEAWQRSSGTVPVLLVRNGHTLYVAVKH